MHEYLCGGMCMYMWVPEDDLQLQGVVSHPLWELETKLRPSASTVQALAAGPTGLYIVIPLTDSKAY